MTPDQKTLVQQTWNQVVPISDRAATMFYDRLFELDPALRQLFAGTDMSAQHKKLVQALASVVNALDRIDEIVPVLVGLGQRHAGYGVRDEHYDTVGAVLLWTLEQGLSDGWKKDVKDAWTQAYGLVAGVMRRASELEQVAIPA